MTLEMPAPHPLRWRLLGLLGIAQLMLILDVTVVAVALPHIESDLGLSRAGMTWAVTAYTLTFGSLLLLGGRIADMVGARRVFLTGLSVFVAALLVTGFAASEGMLLGGRVGQGVGAALLSPAGLSLVVGLFDGAERNRALGVWSALGGGGAALGLLVGGLLTAGPGWPWIFRVNVPVGLVIAVALARLLPRDTAPVRRQRLDLLGALVVTASSAVVIYALIRAGDGGWLTLTTGGLLLLGAAGYATFVVRLRTARTPLVNVGLLARRPVAAGSFLVLVATALMIAVFLLGTFFLQRARGYGALHTGLLFLPTAFATMLGADLTGRTIGRLGARAPAVGGLVVAALGLALPAVVTSTAAVVTGMAIAAAGTGALFVVASATALGHVAPQEAGVASGIVSTFHEYGASLGAAVISSVAAAGLAGNALGGFADGYLAAAAGASVAAVAAGLLVPGRLFEGGRHG